MMKLTFFQVFKQISPDTNNPYIVTETNVTSDGPRTRICEGRYATEEQALSVMEAKKLYVSNILNLAKD